MTLKYIRPVASLHRDLWFMKRPLLQQLSIYNQSGSIMYIIYIYIIYIIRIQQIQIGFIVMDFRFKLHTRNI